MKNLTALILVLTLSFSAHSQESNLDNTSIDGIITNLYGIISGEKGEARDWEAFKDLFHPQAKLVPSGKNKEGKIGARFLTPQDYIDSSGNWLVENGFHEIEISREIQLFGNIAHVFSTYEAKKSKTDTEPFMRGINSIQLFNDGTRWYVLNIFWTQESKENPIPKEYLPK